MLKTAEGSLIGILPKAPTGPKLDLGPVVIESKLTETPLSISYLGTHTGLNVPAKASEYCLPLVYDLSAGAPLNAVSSSASAVRPRRMKTWGRKSCRPQTYRRCAARRRCRSSS